jgi:hypothetical protein
MSSGRRVDLNQVLTLAAFGLIVGMNFLLAYNEVIDNFTYSSIGLAYTVSQEGRLTIAPYSSQVGWSGHANAISLRFVPTMILVFLEEATGMPFKMLAVLPIGGLILAVLSYVLAKNLSGSTKIGLLFAVAMAFEPVNILEVNIYYMATGLLVFWVFLILWNRSLRLPTTAKHIMLLTTLFCIAFFSYYTSEFMILLTVFVFGILVGALTLVRRQPAVERRFLYLALAFIVIFVSFEPVFYQTLANQSESQPVQTILGYFQYVLQVFGGNKAAVSEYRPNYGNMLPIYAFMVQVCLIGLSLGLYLVYRLRLIIKHSSHVSITETVFLALILVGVVEPLVYLLWGSQLAFRSLLWFGMLAAFCSLHRLTRVIKGVRLKKLSIMTVSVVGIVILCCSIVKGVLPMQDPRSSAEPRFFDKMGPTASWIVLYMGNNITTDGQFAAELFAESVLAQKQNDINAVRMNQRNIDFLRSFEDGNYSIFSEKEIPDVLALAKSWSTRSFAGGEIYQTNAPLGDAPEILSQYPTLCRVYDDGRGLVYVRGK